MSVNDRGRIKWQGFFMPEHTKTLKEMWIDDFKIQMPILDDYQIQEFDERIKFAMDNKVPIEFLVFDNGFTENIIGMIKFVDQLNNGIKVITDNDNEEFVLFSEIMNVKLLE